ncbi:hypothetical protein PMIN02_006023 [Paraphaeosphaeria minitans]
MIADWGRTGSTQIDYQYGRQSKQDTPATPLSYFHHDVHRTQHQTATTRIYTAIGILDCVESSSGSWLRPPLASEHFQPLWVIVRCLHSSFCGEARTKVEFHEHDLLGLYMYQTYRRKKRSTYHSSIE